MKKVVIIGAGPAGLTAAYQFLKDNDDVQLFIIEQSSQVGGISKTVEYNGNRIDLGGHRFFSKIDSINQIWLEILQLQGCPIDAKIEEPQLLSYSGSADPNTTDDVMLVRRRISRIYYEGKFFDYPISLNWDTIRKLGVLRSVKCGLGYIWSCVFKSRGNSLEDFYINRFGRPLYNLFFKEYTTKLWGVPPSKLDSSWGAQRIKKLSLFKLLKDFFLKSFNKNYITTESSLIEQFFYPKFGPGQLWEKLAQKIEDDGGVILYNSTCTKIITDNNKIKSIKINNDKNQEIEIECDYLISSMSIKKVVSSLDADVPKNVKNIACNLPYRDFITVGLLVDRIKLENTTNIKTLNNIPPDCWIYVQDGNVKVGRIQFFNNWSPYMVRKPEKYIWIGLEYFCSECDVFWNQTDEEIAMTAVNELLFMKIIDRDNIIDSVVLRQKKAYPAYFGTYSRFNIVKEYLNGFKNLICVGRNGQHRYNNMDHSMLTGINAVKYVNGQIGIEDVWNVNVEQEYHEEGN